MSKKSNLRPNKGNSLITFPTKYIVVDLETTGLSPEYDSIIEISALKVVDDSITDTFSTIVNSECYIDSFITELTGITNEMVANAPSLDVVLDTFKEFVDNNTIVGHNVNFDINFLYDNFEFSKNHYFTNNFVDTMRLARRLLPELKHHRLSDLCKHFNISCNNSHRALFDCEYTYQVFNNLKNIVIDKYNSIDEFTKSCKPKKYSETLHCVSTKTEFDISHPLYNKVCVFTGTLENMTRAEASQIVVDFGGSCGSSVTKATNYLILGNNDYCSTIKDGKSRKQKAAEQIKLNGGDIEIIPENVFYDMITVSDHSIAISDHSIETEKGQNKKFELTDQELELCAYIQSVIVKMGGDTNLLRFNKNSSGYLEISCLYHFLKFKFQKKGKYIIIKSGNTPMSNYITESCTETEGGTDYTRVYFSSPFDLDELSEFIYNAFLNSFNSMKIYTSYSDSRKQKVKKITNSLLALTDEEIVRLLNDARNRNYAPVTVSVEKSPNISIENIEINTIHNRVPLNEIKNKDDSNMGYDKGSPFFYDGETERKKGNLISAIELFDKARLNGYNAPALYTSYALTYRKLKDYGNEIEILNEGISRLPHNSSEWSVRRDKAIKLLFAQQEKERKTAEKEQLKADKERLNVEQRIQKEVAKSETRQSRSRTIFQMDDSYNIIREFESIAAASQAIGVSSKCIRDAANGVQKTAGGFHWMYKEK